MTFLKRLIPETKPPEPFAGHLSKLKIQQLALLRSNLRKAAHSTQPLASHKKTHLKRSSLVSSLERTPGFFRSFPKKSTSNPFQLPIYFLQGHQRASQDLRETHPNLLSISDEVLENHPEKFLSAIQHLPFKGSLHQTVKGVIYLDLDDDFIFNLHTFLSTQSADLPPYFGFSTLPEGAHVPVISASEYVNYEVHKIAELEKEFSFTIKGLSSVKPIDWEGAEKVWFLEIESKDLELLREKYHLPSKIRGHSFHIVVGIRKKEQSSAPLPMMRINPACYAA